MARKNAIMTIQDAMHDITRMEDKAAALEAAASYLRTRYVKRDSAMPVARIKRPEDGGVVDEAHIVSVADELEDMAADYRNEAEANRREQVSG